MRRWIWFVILLIWAVALSWPYEGLPPVREFLLYPTSPLQIDYTQVEKQFDNSDQPGLEINYDHRGVPHIFAESDTAMAFGMGFTHAKDRLFQLEMLRRTVRGRLSEVAGAKAIPSDRWWLKFNFEQKSVEAFEKMKEQQPQLTRVFEAYARGFNFYLKNLVPAEKPLEYHLLGFEPSPMKAYAPIMLVRYMDKVLNYSENDLKFSALRKHLPDSLIEFYYPWLSDYAFPIYPELSHSPQDSQQLRQPGYTPKSNFHSAMVRRGDANEVGSNNWSVAAEKSATGNAFLCNDTHLGLDLPGTWYEVHQVSGDRIIHGFSIPGSPFVVSGFTENVAWGMTNATWDLTEFYHLKTNENNQYELDGNWEELKPRKVSIPVKGQNAVQVTYFDTWFGPTDTIDSEMLATQWVADNFESNEMLAFYQLTYAQNLDEAYQAMLNFGHPPQNFVLADKQGDIGMLTSGYALLHNSPSRGISLGTSRDDKAEFVHQGKRLKVLNPKKAWNQSSNHHQVTDSLAPYLNTIFAPSARGRRISEMMQNHEKIGRQQLKSMHGDVKDGEWDLLRPHIMGTVPQEYLSYFRQWDGSCKEASVAATLYNAYKWALRDSLSTLLLGDFDFKPPAEHLFYLLTHQSKLPTAADSIDISTVAMGVWKKVGAELTANLGPQSSEWRYERYHKIYFRHIARVEALSYPPFGAKGSPRTVNVSSGLPGTHGPSMRTLVELRPEGPKAQTVLAAGQSGQAAHPNYTDQIDEWYDLEYFPVKWVRKPGDMTWRQTINFE